MSRRRRNSCIWSVAATATSYPARRPANIPIRSNGKPEALSPEPGWHRDLLDEFTAFLNRGLGRPPGHDRHRGGRVFGRTFDQLVRIDHVDQHVALGIAAAN